MKMLIGRQEDTGFGGHIDLLAIQSPPDGDLVLIELKRENLLRLTDSFSSPDRSCSKNSAATIFSRASK
jgi:hypothetical protein